MRVYIDSSHRDASTGLVRLFIGLGATTFLSRKSPQDPNLSSLPVCSAPLEHKWDLILSCNYRTLREHQQLANKTGAYLAVRQGLGNKLRYNTKETKNLISATPSVVAAFKQLGGNAVFAPNFLGDQWKAKQLRPDDPPLLCSLISHYERNFPAAFKIVTAIQSELPEYRIVLAGRNNPDGLQNDLKLLPRASLYLGIKPFGGGDNAAIKAANLGLPLVAYSKYWPQQSLQHIYNVRDVILFDTVLDATKKIRAYMSRSPEEQQIQRERIRNRAQRVLHVERYTKAVRDWLDALR